MYVKVIQDLKFGFLNDQRFAKKTKLNVVSTFSKTERFISSCREKNNFVQFAKQIKQTVEHLSQTCVRWQESHVRNHLWTPFGFVNCWDGRSCPEIQRVQCVWNLLDFRSSIDRFFGRVVFVSKASRLQSNRKSIESKVQPWLRRLMKWPRWKTCDGWLVEKNKMPMQQTIRRSKNSVCIQNLKNQSNELQGRWFGDEGQTINKHGKAKNTCF